MRPIRHVQLIVKSVQALDARTKLFELEDSEGWRLPPFQPGAHIDIFLPDGMVRTYSLCNPPADDRRYAIAVQREDAGRGGSLWMHDKLQPGSAVEVSLPRAGFQADPQKLNVFVAGGIGVTPFVSAILDMERRGQTNYVLHWASRGKPALAETLEPFAKSGRIRVYDSTAGARLDVQALLSAIQGQAKAYCCGPDRLTQAFEQAVADWPHDASHIERFTAPALPPSPDSKPFTLVLAKSGKQAEVGPGETLADALQALGAPVAISCGGGVCGACRTRYLEGSPIHRDRAILTEQERQTQLMVCVAGCSSPRLVLDL